MTYNWRMKEHKLSSEVPGVITLAADWRLSTTNYFNDIIWEVSLGVRDPDSISLNTTMGLRCAGFRLFPRFIRKDGTLSQPAKFHHPPEVQQAYPNYARIIFSPYTGLEVLAEYHAASSDVICGRMTFSNKSILKEQFRFEWVGVLNPLAEGRGLAVTSVENEPILEGSSGDVHIVCCMGKPVRPGSGPFTALSQDIELFPNSQAAISWSTAAAKTRQDAYSTAQAAIQKRLPAEFSRLELVNKSEEIEVLTGNDEWDAALLLTQRATRQLFFPAGGGLPNPSFVVSRRPDNGYSISGEGGDYPPSWSGQTVMDAYFLSNLILPGGLKWMKGILQNFLAVQTESGEIDWRPGLGGQRSHHLAQPILASLALTAAEMSGEIDWLKDIYPGLLRFIRRWFGKEHDRDLDGFPEWSHPLQTGLEDAPLYDRWQNGSQGVDLNVLESPALGAMLVRECRSLCKIGTLLSAEAEIPWLEQQIEHLTGQIQETWQSGLAMYRYRDHLTHSMGATEPVQELSGNGIFPLSRAFSSSQRLLIQVVSVDQISRAVNIRIKGMDGKTEVEEIFNPQRFNWAGGLGRATSLKVFTEIELIEVRGAKAEDRILVKTPDYSLEDISLFLPLWAGIPTQDQAREMVQKNILTGWMKKFGLPTCAQIHPDEDETSQFGVSIPWNLLVGEGLLLYGFRKEAAELVRRLMEGVVYNLRNYHDFHSKVDANSGRAMGETGHLHGMAPVGLLLRTAGIHQISPKRLIIETGSPFSHAITVKYKGTEVKLGVKETQVSFPSGQNVHLTESGLHQIDWQ